MKKTAIALSLLVSTSAFNSASVHADGHTLSPLSETAISVGFASTKIDDLDATLTGYAINAAFQFENGVYIKQTMNSASDDVSMYNVSIDLELELFTTSLGYQFLESDTGVYYAELGYLKGEATSNGFSSEDSEVTFALGTKRIFTDKVVGVFELEQINSETSIGAELQYSFTESVAVNAGLQLSDEQTTYGVNLKWFPNI